MNLEKFIEYIGVNIDYFDTDEIQFLVLWKYTELFKSLNKKYVNEEDYNKKNKMEDIVIFLNTFIKSYNKNAYMYDYRKSKKFGDYKYWFDFYIRNKMLSKAQKVVEDVEKKIPQDQKLVDRLKHKLEKYNQTYNNEYKVVKDLMEKNTDFEKIDNYIGEWNYSRAIQIALSLLQKYPDDNKIKNMIGKINDLKDHKNVVNIDLDDSYFNKIWLLSIKKQEKLEDSDMKQLFSKFKVLLRKRDFVTWLALIDYIRTKHNVKDPKLLKFQHKFVNLQTVTQQKEQKLWYKLEFKSLTMMYQNKQYQNAINKANVILKKYPLIDKNKVYKVLQKINKEKNNLLRKKDVSKIDLWLESINAALSPMWKKSIFIFYEKMSWFLLANMDLKTALQVIMAQAKDQGLKNFVKDVIESLSTGMQLSEILRLYDVVNNLDISLIKIWETTWELWNMFGNIYNIYKDENERAQKIRWVMIYPAVVITVTFAIFIWLLVFVMPKFVEFFASAKVELPWITAFLLDVSAFLQSYWYLALMYLWWTIFWLKVLSRTELWEYFFSTLRLYTPVVKEIVAKKYIVYFTSNLSILLDAWISLQNALDLIIFGAMNKVYQDEFKRIKFELETWESLGQALWLNTWKKRQKDVDFSDYTNPYIPIDVAFSIDIWEKTWKLSELMKSSTERYDKELKMIITNLQSLLEPFIIIFIWAILFTFVLAVFLPMINMYNAMGKMGGL